MDWSDPTSEAISIATVYRQADSDPMGFILVNPGGPGASGYDWVRDSPEYVGTETLRESWNIVGFDPRGVGSSSAVECLTDSEYDDFLYGVTGYELGSEQDLAASATATSEFAAKCQENTGALLQFVDTVSAARDMDVLRAVFGQENLNFLGYSYGSFLGTTYATLFPSRVGRFVLDGGIDPTVSDSQQTILQIQAFEKALEAFLENCEQFEDCPFSSDVPLGQYRIQQFLLELENEPLETSSGRELTIWAAITGLIMPLYSESYWPYLSTSFSDAFNGSGDGFLILADMYNDRNDDGTYSTNLIAANYAIGCLDSGGVAEMSEVEEKNKQLIEVAPTLGRYWQFGGLRCATWPYPEAAPPSDYSAKGAPPIMVIGTTGDPATPYSEAKSLAEEVLADGFLVTYNGEGHTVYGGDVECINEVVDNFFFTGKLPATDPNCS
jgi:pimeloyl-ACP methyl ester carboxylesterase